MPTDDQQILVAGVADAPADFIIPGNGQITPKAVNAIYDGTNAAGDFMPTLEIVSDAGVVVARVPASTVLAGNSAEVTWAPFLEAPASAAPAGLTAAYAIGYTDSGRGDSAITVNAGTNQRAQFQHFFSTDATILSEDSFFGLNTAIRLHSVGVYLVMGTAFFTTNPGQTGAIIYQPPGDQVPHQFIVPSVNGNSTALLGLATSEDFTIVYVSGGSQPVSLLLMNDGSIGGASFAQRAYLTVTYIGPI